VLLKKVVTLVEKTVTNVLQELILTTLINPPIHILLELVHLQRKIVAKMESIVFMNVQSPHVNTYILKRV
jgi:hypothetical protein